MIFFFFFLYFRLMYLFCFVDCNHLFILYFSIIFFLTKIYIIYIYIIYNICIYNTYNIRIIYNTYNIRIFLIFSYRFSSNLLVIMHRYVTNNPGEIYPCYLSELDIRFPDAMGQLQCSHTMATAITQI